MDELRAVVGLGAHGGMRIDAVALRGQLQLVFHGFVAAQAGAHHQHGIATLIQRRAGALQIEGAQAGRMVFRQHSATLHRGHHTKTHGHQALHRARRMPRPPP